MPLAIDLFSGLGGWTEGLLAEGYNVVGFDIERHQYGDQKYPAQLVLQDVLTIHGSQFKDAALIVASPPRQEFSYMAMPFSRGKRIAAALRGKGEFPEPYTGSRTIAELTALFDACFRIQREACEAAGRHIPMVVENVKGAQPWVGKAKANYGSFFLWGDVDMVGDRIIAGGLRWDSIRAAKRGAQKRNPDGTSHGQGSWFKIADSKDRGSKNTGGSWFAVAHNTDSGHGNNARDALVESGRKVPGMNFHDFEKTGKPGRSFQSAAVDGLKTTGHVNKRDGHSHTRHLTNQRESDGVKQAGLSGAAWFDHGAVSMSSESNSRKAASAQIAKIPLPLSSYIARAYRPVIL